MDARLTDIRFRDGCEPVDIDLVTPFGKMTIRTTDGALAARAGAPNWGNAECRAFVQDVLTDLYPDAGFTVVAPD